MNRSKFSNFIDAMLTAVLACACFGAFYIAGRNDGVVLQRALQKNECVIDADTAKNYMKKYLQSSEK